MRAIIKIKRPCHPDLCKKYLDHGSYPNSCDKGTKCDKYHVKICPKSHQSKECPNKGRCPEGYHIRGTLLKTDSSPVTKDGKGISDIRTFLGEVVRTELRKILKPKVQNPHSTHKDQDILSALRSLME